MTARTLVHRLLLPAVLVIPALIFAGWLIRGAQGSELLAVLLGSPACLILLVGLSGVVWARPDVREDRAVSGRDVAILGAVWAVWILGALLPAPAGPILLAVAVVATIVAVILEALQLKKVVKGRLDAQLDHLRSQGANPTWGTPRTRAPRDGAGTIIEGKVSPTPAASAASRETMSGERARSAAPAAHPADEELGLSESGVAAPAQPAADSAAASAAATGAASAADATGASATAGDASAPAAPRLSSDPASPDDAPAAQDGRARYDASGVNRGPGPEPTGPFMDGAMPGSTRTGAGELPETDSTRPGVNFGYNKAPASPTWDPSRPVGPRGVAPKPAADASDAGEQDDERSASGV